MSPSSVKPRREEIAFDHVAELGHVDRVGGEPRRPGQSAVLDISDSNG
jgi:hypothetical protein